MKKNVGLQDKSLRLLAANALILMTMFGAIKGALANAAFWIGVAVLFTSLFSFCPLYALLGISTKKD